MTIPIADVSTDFMLNLLLKAAKNANGLTARNVLRQAAVCNARLPLVCSTSTEQPLVLNTATATLTMSMD